MSDNIKQDIAETNDLARSEPGRLLEMKRKLTAKYHEVRDESPVWPNWKWPRYEGKRIQEFRQSLKKADSKSN